MVDRFIRYHPYFPRFLEFSVVSGIFSIIHPKSPQSGHGGIVATSWWEVEVIGAAALEESITWRLQDSGCQGTACQLQAQRQRCRVCGYLPQSQYHTLDLAAIASQLRQDALLMEAEAPSVSWQLVHEQDWATSWQQFWHPMEVGDRLLIYPAWLELPETSERLLLRLNPGVAFGTGTHATTQLCLEALEMQLDQTFGPVDHLVLADIGCGSGILAIAAILLGAAKVYAVDTDVLAVDSSKGSLELNQISQERVVVGPGSAAQIPEPVDGVICNILADVIIKLLPDITTITKPGGWAIFSGLLTSQSHKVNDALVQNGWQVGSMWKKEDWCCINAIRNP
jgi:ribosomal protein L11 methyltransferase